VSIFRMTPPTVCSRRIAPHRNSRAAVAVGGIFRLPNVRMREISRSDYPRLKKEYVETGMVQSSTRICAEVDSSQALPAVAAVAPVCEHFWPMHDALYANPGARSPELYPKLAHDSGWMIQVPRLSRESGSEAVRHARHCRSP